MSVDIGEWADVEASWRQRARTYIHTHGHAHRPAAAGSGPASASAGFMPPPPAPPRAAPRVARLCSLCRYPRDSIKEACASLLLLLLLLLLVRALAHITSVPFLRRRRRCFCCCLVSVRQMQGACAAWTQTEPRSLQLEQATPLDVSLLSGTHRA